MKTDHPNAAMIRDAMDRMGTEGFPALADLLTDDVVWHQIGETEPMRGRGALVERMEAMSQRISSNFDVFDVLADDTMGVGYGRANMRMGDRSTSYDAVEIYRFRDGKIAERWAMVGDMEAMQRFWEGV